MWKSFLANWPLRLFLLSCLFFSASHSMVAQTTTDVIVGPVGGGLYDNYFAGVRGGIETNSKVAPYVYGEIDPYSSHTKLGSGYAYSVEAGSVVWLNKSIGLNGNAERSAYVNTISKAGYYAKGGLAIKHPNPWGKDRLFFNYVQQFNNGVDKHGTETAKLKGGQFIFDADMGCAKHFCNRIYLNVEAGRVLTQGNPVCDGTDNPKCVTCKRTPAVSGGAELGWIFQFGGR